MSSPRKRRRPAGERLLAGGDEQAALNAAAVSQTGGNQPHENRQPYLALNYIIALTGIFPSRS